MKCKAVINIFGGAGSGKSTVSAGLFYNMKMRHFNVEMTGEYAKNLVYEERQNMLIKDQLSVFSRQNRWVYRLVEQVDYIISDSPLVLAALYFNDQTNIYNSSLFKTLVIDTFKKYPNINFVLERNSDLEFKGTEGRIHDARESLEIDNRIKMALDFFDIPYTSIKVDGENTVNEILKNVIEE